MNAGVEGNLCTGVEPLTARLEGWQRSMLERPELLAGLLDEHGSPLNLIDPAPLGRNLDELGAVARAHGVPLRAFFARKANKALSLVDRALELGAGVDVAGLEELEQALGRGARPEDLIVTAAIKSHRLLELCAACGIPCAIDNADELELAAAVVATPGFEADLPIAFRLAVSGAGDGRPPTRFGLPAGEALELGRRLREDASGGLRLEGLHFHVDGYDPEDRARGLRECLALADGLARVGHRIAWIDIGGGVPMRYLDDPAEWERFWAEHRRALAGEREPLTYLGHGLGLRASDGRIEGAPAVYPAAQRLIRGAWLERVLEAEAGGAAGPGNIAGALVRRGLELRCEPGRSLLDGCGMTLARVAFRKRGASGDALIGVEMNRTQMRTTSDDSMLDPLLVRPPSAGPPSDPLEGYLVGSYCIERELLSWRRLRFPAGVAVGDLVAFPNTAGYFMHILESSSHQMPLARNLVVAGGELVGRDPIEADDT